MTMNVTIVTKDAFVVIVVVVICYHCSLKLWSQCIVCLWLL